MGLVTVVVGSAPGSTCCHGYSCYGYVADLSHKTDEKTQSQQDLRQYSPSSVAGEWWVGGTHLFGGGLQWLTGGRV